MNFSDFQPQRIEAYRKAAGPQLGMLGEPGVNVLRLNRSLGGL